MYRHEPETIKKRHLSQYHYGVPVVETKPRGGEVNRKKSGSKETQVFGLMNQRKDKRAIAPTVLPAVHFAKTERRPGRCQGSMRDAIKKINQTKGIAQDTLI